MLLSIVWLDSCLIRSIRLLSLKPLGVRKKTPASGWCFGTFVGMTTAKVAATAAAACEQIYSVTRPIFGFCLPDAEIR